MEKQLNLFGTVNEATNPAFLVGAVSRSVSRFNIFENSKLIGQNYKSGSGKWMHKWFFKSSFERGGWLGLAKGENDKNWIYEPINEN